MNNIHFEVTFISKSGTGSLQTPEVLLSTKDIEYHDNIISIRNMINSFVPSNRVSQIGKCVTYISIGEMCLILTYCCCQEIQYGEWALNWAGTDKDYTHFNFLWSTSILGHILSAGGNSL